VRDPGNLSGFDDAQVIVQSNRAPVANAGPDQVLECLGPSTPATLDGSASSDPDGDPLGFAWSIAGAPVASGVGPTLGLALGVTAVELSVSDPGGLSASDQVAIDVRDTTPPQLSCPAPQVAECMASGCASVAPAAATASDVCGGVTIEGPASACFPLGTTATSYTATDAQGLTASCVSSITVQDTLGPVISGALDAGELWPPNHRYRTIRLADCGIVIADACGGPSSLAQAGAAITCVSSDEPDNAPGDGNSVDDIVLVDATTVKLRQERDGGGDGRVYRIGFRVRDAAGNSSDGVCVVSVPHDAPTEAPPAVDSGPAHARCAQ
jgi:hypothetical protein